MAKAPRKKAPSGTLTDRLNEARNRPYKGTKGGAVTKVTKPRATGRQYSGDTIKMKGPQQGVTKPKVVPLGDRPKLLSGPKTGTAKAAIGVAARNAAVRAVGVGAVFDPSFMSYKTGGAAGVRGESDRPSGPLFSPSKNRAAGRGNPKTVNPYRKSSSMAGGSKMAKSTQSGAVRPKISMAGGGVNKPETASTFKQKNLAANQKAGKDAAAAQAAPKAAAPAAAPKQPKGMTFQQAVRRNVTEEYTKKKMKPKGSLLGLLRKRKSMG